MLLDLYVWVRMVVSNVFFKKIDVKIFATLPPKLENLVEITLKKPKFPKFQVKKSEFSLRKKPLVVRVNMVAHNKGSNWSN